MTRRYDPRRAKRHRSYSALELSALFRVSIGAVRNWTSNGLTPLKGIWPFCFAGSDVQDFLAQFNKPRQPLQSGELYCVACKRAIRPEDSTVDFCPLTPTSGDLIGTCPHCLRRPHRRVRKAEILEKTGNLKVRFEDGSVAFAGDGNPARTGPFEGTRS